MFHCKIKTTGSGKEPNNFCQTFKVPRPACQYSGGVRRGSTSHQPVESGHQAVTVPNAPDTIKNKKVKAFQFPPAELLASGGKADLLWKNNSASHLPLVQPVFLRLPVQAAADGSSPARALLPPTLNPPGSLRRRAQPLNSPET